MQARHWTFALKELGQDSHLATVSTTHLVKFPLIVKAMAAPSALLYPYISMLGAEHVPAITQHEII